MSFEVKSISDYESENVKMKDCLKYLDKGKILHKFENKFSYDSDNITKTVITIFSYNQKTYEHTLYFSVSEYERGGKKRIDTSYLESSDCIMIDFDKSIKD